MLAYGCPSDSVDEYVKIGESTCNFYFERFCLNIFQMYGSAYLGDPGKTQNERVLFFNANRGLPGLQSCLDNYCWSWDNCPTAWKVQFTGKDGVPVVKLESACQADLYTVFMNSGDAGCLNDINTLVRSPVIEYLNSGVFRNYNYELNGKARHGAYMFVDGIYPNWSTFAKTMSKPRNAIEVYYAKT
jgi:hypothetical protein